VGFVGPRWIIQLISALVATVVGGSGPASPAAGPQFGPPPGRTASLTVQAPNSWSAVASWKAVKGADRYQILRDGRLIDDFPADSDRTYTDHLLWPSSTYGYQLKALGGGEVLAVLLGTVTTPAQTDSFPRFYSDASFWNTRIPASPSIDPNSADMVSTSLAAFGGRGVINSGDDWGIPLAYADAHSKTYTIECLLFGCETTVRFRIPRYATPNTESDGHLAIYDPTTNQELDLWQGAYDPRTRTWAASSRTATASDWGAVCPEGKRCGGGGTAAGFLEFGGVIRPEEIAQGHIDHALVLSAPSVRAEYIACPATNYWASLEPQYKRDPGALPLGARVQLDPEIDVDAKPWPAWEKVVAKALQTYGAYIADVSGSLELRGEANLDRGYDAWAEVGMTTFPKPDLANLPWERFRVLTMASC
jgi:hypothetical protein